MSKFTKFAARARSMVGGDSLDRIYYRFLLVHTGFMIFTGLPGVFINTFLMSQTSTMDVVLIYNVLGYAGTAVGMLISAAVIHWLNAGVVSVIGIVGFNLLYFQLILYGTHAAAYVVLLGVTSGLAGAFYWMSYSQLLTEYTNLQNRDSGMAIISIMSSGVNVVIPLFAGAMISVLGGILGYNVVFGLAFLIGIITAIGAVRLPKPASERSTVRHKQAFLLIRRRKALRFALLSEACKGIREGAFGFILSVLLYHLIKSEFLIGFNTFLSSGVSILSFWMISKHVNGSNRIRYMEVAVGVLFAFSVVNVFAVSPAELVVFTVVNSFFAGFILNSSFGNFLDVLQIVPEARNLRPELFAQKEMYLASGRCFGIFLILLVDRLSGGSMLWQALSLVFLTATQVGTVAASRHTSCLAEQQKSGV
ncbi:MAG: MFS transporter [Clostridiales bacterium]|nr:MFS transporter [Clostridiales bacterium]